MEKKKIINISVIIPTFNNYRRLNLTLHAFSNLNIPPDVSWELIIVNNNSNDITKEIIIKYIDKLPIKYIYEPDQGTSRAKNAGLFSSNGDLIIFTDDDVTPCDDWLKNYWQEYLSNSNNFFWGGPVESDFEMHPVDLRLISMGPASVKGLNWGNSKRKLLPKEYFVGANWAAPSGILKHIGGFNVELGLNASPEMILIGEETDIMNRLQATGLTPIYLPSCSIRHFVPKSKMTLEHIAARAEASGRFSANLYIKSPSVCVLGVPRWVWRKTALLLLCSQLKRLFNIDWYAEYIEYRHLSGCIKQLINRN